MAGKRVVIFGSTIERAILKLNQVIDILDIRDRMETIQTSGVYSVRFKNGDLFTATDSLEGAKASRWDYAYIDGLLSKDVVKYIIMPGCSKQAMEKEEKCFEYY